jgi:hypothetical protein
MPKSLYFMTALALALQPAYAIACATNMKTAPAAGAWKAYFKAQTEGGTKTRRPSSNAALPDPGQDPWGGPDHWRPEAIVANAVSEMLNAGWREAGVEDVLVALPVKMLNSNLNPYDNQVNASLSLGEGWSQSKPVLIAQLVKYKEGKYKLTFRFHNSLANVNKGVEVTYERQGKVLTRNIPLSRQTASGDFEFEWQIGGNGAPEWGDLFANRVAFVRPVGWKDWFPVDFRDVTRGADELLNQVPVEKRKLGKGTLLDPESITSQGRDNDSYPFLAMGNESFGKEINGDRYFPVDGPGIHNQFPSGNAITTTAVGHGNTLVMEKPPAPFKLAYICFDNRDPRAEKGVPSGVGWHEIGDNAETVFNTLENAPILFGNANGQPKSSTPSGGFAYGLTDVSVFRLLLPGRALITAAGPTTIKERQNSIQANANKRGETPTNSGRNYHWFAIHHDHPVCAIEWVHPCVPSPDNHWGLQCGS